MLDNSFIVPHIHFGISYLKTITSDRFDKKMKVR